MTPLRTCAVVVVGGRRLLLDWREAVDYAYYVGALKLPAREYFTRAVDDFLLVVGLVPDFVVQGVTSRAK